MSNDINFRKYKQNETLSEELKEYLYINLHKHTVKTFQFSKDWLNDVYIDCLSNKDFTDEHIKMIGKKLESRKILENRKNRGMKRITVTDENGNKSRQWRKVELTDMTVEQFEHRGIDIDSISEFSTPHEYLQNDPYDTHMDDCDNYY